MDPQSRTRVATAPIALVFTACAMLLALTPALTLAEDSPVSGEPAPAPAPEFAGHWEGAIEVPSNPLTIRIDLERGEDGWTGTFDSPDQGANGLPLTAIRAEGDHIVFGIRGVPGDPLFDGRLAGGRIEGSMTQFGQKIPFHLGREKAKARTRPQDPQPPYPYREEEVTLEGQGVTLAGTLTIPEGAGPFPAALLLSGSGAQNRNEEVFGHRPFLVLADFLTRAGIAVLRLDDRGVGGSTGDLSASTVNDLAADALAATAYLAGRDEVDAERVGLIGHSEGGIVAPLAASRSDAVAFVIMLAGTGVTGDRVLAHQMDLLLAAAGVSDDSRGKILEEQRKLIELIHADAPREALRKQYRALAEAQAAAVPGAPPPDAELLDQAAAAGAAQMATPWFRAFLSYDPAPALRKLHVPVLALFGEKDLQVDPAQNLAPIREALEAAGDEDVTLTVLPGLNHLFQTASSGAPGEYAGIEQTIAPQALETIRDWILARFSAPEPKG